MTRVELAKIKAAGLGFTFEVLGADLFRIVQRGGSRGYRGKLVGVEAYLQGWDEAKLDEGRS